MLETTIGRRLVCIAAVALVCVSGGAGAEPAAHVASLRFEGVASIPQEALETKLLTRGPAWHGLKFWETPPAYDPADLREDLERIAEIYREHGYFEAEARSDLEWNEDASEVSIRLVVEEGEPIRLASLSVRFVEDARLAQEIQTQLIAAVPLSVGDIFGSRAYAEARKALLQALGERGHPAATLEGGARVDLARREGFVEWILDPGPLVRFGEIRLTGLEGVDSLLVRRELVVETGTRYTIAAQRESERKLRDTELFHAVAVQPLPSEASQDAGGTREAVWPLEIRLRERPPRSVRVAAGYGTEEQLRGRIAWRHRNFLGGGRKLEVAGEYSSLLAGGTLRFLQPHFFDPELLLGIEASLAQETTPAFEALRAKGRTQLTRPIFEPWEARVGYALEFADVTKVEANEPGAEESSRVSALFVGLRRDTLDDRLEPSRGTWLDLHAQPALQVIGSSASYATLVAEGRAFQQWRRLVFGGRLRLGTIEPLAASGTGDVPIFERFFSGGSTSVRGYDYQSLGPRNGNEPLGGLTVSEASFEVRVPLPWWSLSLIGFVDAGQVSRNPWSFRGRDVQFGAGPGLRLATPVGPLRFDLGLPLNPRSDDAPFRLHFAVGHAF